VPIRPPTPLPGRAGSCPWRPLTTKTLSEGALRVAAHRKRGFSARGPGHITRRTVSQMTAGLPDRSEVTDVDGEGLA